jgi:hypothetical protein
MESSEEILKNFVNSKSKFFNLADGEEATVKYLSAEALVTYYTGNQVNSIRYHVEENGVEKSWDRTSRELAEQMSKFSPGDWISIRRDGERNKTKYSIKKIEK